MSILITTGATVTFRKLVDEVTNASFLNYLKKTGFTAVYLQYGNETDPKSGENISKAYFSELLASKSIIETFDFEIANEFNDKSVTTFKSQNFSFIVFGFSLDIASYIQKADLVVSHAGTGSILDTLRLKKPLIVVTNDSLMDNHQAEIADRFEIEGYLAKVSELQLGQGLLQKRIGEWKNGELRFEQLPEPPSGVLQSVISEELKNV